jgi:serine protease
LKRSLRLLATCAATAALALAIQAPVATAAQGSIHGPRAMPVNGIQPPPVDICQQLPACPPGVAAGQPGMVNMAYFGGHVQVSPKIYLVFWGWGQAGAFSHTTAGRPANDPDGAAARMSAFIAAIGGSQWTASQTQYYQVSGGATTNISNPANQLGGVWYDDGNPIHNNVSGLELAQEAGRAVTHFGVTDLANSQFVVAQPQNYNEAGFVSGAGYCAWHDYTVPSTYPGVQTGISFTNMPYVLNSGGGCGKDFVNAAPQGDLDGVTIVLGHEVEETVTDPGAETFVNGVQYGGWFDYQGWENGDKCAWVGDGVGAVPDAAYNMSGNDGRTYPVQTLWSNSSLQGVGYCAPSPLG